MEKPVVRGPGRRKRLRRTRCGQTSARRGRPGRQGRGVHAAGDGRRLLQPFGGLHGVRRFRSGGQVMSGRRTNVLPPSRRAVQAGVAGVGVGRRPWQQDTGRLCPGDDARQPLQAPAHAADQPEGKGGPVMPHSRRLRTRGQRRAASPRGRLSTRSGSVVTTISLGADQHRRAAVAAAERGWVLTGLFRQAVGEWLAKHDRQGRRRTS